jgi:hypothetical protein
MMTNAARPRFIPFSPAGSQPHSRGVSVRPFGVRAGAARATLLGLGPIRPFIPGRPLPPDGKVAIPSDAFMGSRASEAR